MYRISRKIKFLYDFEVFYLKEFLGFVMSIEKGVEGNCLGKWVTEVGE